jgi:hypothetical protein
MGCILEDCARMHGEEGKEGRGSSLAVKLSTDGHICSGL